MIKSVKRSPQNGIQFCIIALLVLVLSCTKHDKPPEGVLSRDEMVNVLSELYIVEQKISTLGVKRDSLVQIFDSMKGRVFEKVGITDSVFRKSLNFYIDHPEVLEGVYTSLIDSLNLREQRVLSSSTRK